MSGVSGGSRVHGPRVGLRHWRSSERSQKQLLPDPTVPRRLSTQGVTSKDDTNPVGERPNVSKVRHTKLRRRLAGQSRGRCLLTNSNSVRGATLWAVGNERCASLVSCNSRCRASRTAAKTEPSAEIWLIPCSDRAGYWRQHTRKGCIETGEALLAPGRKTPEQGRFWQQDRRPEGGRWARSSEEPPVTRRDPGTSGERQGKASPSRCEGARLADTPWTK